MFINHPKGPCLPSRVNESVRMPLLVPKYTELHRSDRRLTVGRRLPQYSKVKGCISTDTPRYSQVYKSHSPPTTHSGQSCQLSSSQLYSPRMHLYGPKFRKITVIARTCTCACEQEMVPVWHVILLLGALWKEPLEPMHWTEPMHLTRCSVRMN